jgi:hypothetical protein
VTNEEAQDAAQFAFECLCSTLFEKEWFVVSINRITNVVCLSKDMADSDGALEVNPALVTLTNRNGNRLDDAHQIQPGDILRLE